MASMDFTHATELGVTIAGVLFVHMFFEFVLAYSGWRFVQLAFGETFEALVKGLQGALWALGGVPQRVRQDNLSAATHELAKTGGRGLTRRFAEVVEHYGFDPSRIRPGESHENGVVEKAHHLLKSALEQALLLRGIRDFPSVEAYMVFVGQVVEETFHQGREARLAEERAALKPLPSSRVPEYTRVVVEVRKWSTVPVAGHIYSVPSRLIGHEVEARVYADVVEIRYANKTVETMPRLRGERRASHRLPARDLVAGAQARRLRGVPVPRGPVPLAGVPAGLRRPPRAPWRPRRRGVRAGAAPGREHGRARGGAGALGAAGARRGVRLRRGQGAGAAGGADGAAAPHRRARPPAL